MDDFVLNVRQIAQYPTTQPSYDDTVLFQQGGVGGPYASSSIQDLVAAGADQPAPSSLAGGTSPVQLTGGVLSLTGADPAIAFNGRWDAGFYGRRVAGGPASLIWSDQQNGNLYFEFFSTGAADDMLTGKLIASIAMAPDGSISANRLLLSAQGQSDADAVTVGWINRQAVRSFNGRFGAIRLNARDIQLAGGALACNSELTGTPLAPTADGSCKHQVANVECVEKRVADWINGLINEHPFVFTFNDRRGDIWLRADDITAASFLDPDNPPEVPTAPDGTATDQIASTAFVSQGLQDLQDWVDTTLAEQGDVTLAYLEANYAPLASPQLSGNPTAPTAAPGNATGQIATTGFVMNAVAASTAGVASFNNRTGHVDLELADVTGVGGAPLASPVFTGNPQAPTPSAGNASAALATTQFVASNSVASFNTRTGAVTLSLADITAAGGAPSASPFFTGSPQAPTLPPGTNNQQLATTAFVMAEVAASTAGVASWNGRSGNVSLQANDLSAVGGALTASPSFSGTPSAPTAAPGTSTTQLATTAFVQAALGTGVTSFNGRSGTVNLTNSDVVAVTGPLAAPGSALPNMDGVANAGISAAYSRQDHVHPTDTSLATVAQLANYLPRDGSQPMTGRLTLPSSAQCLVSAGFGNFMTSAQHSFQPANANICVGSYSAFGGGGNIAARVDNSTTYLVGFSYNGTFTGSITTNGTTTNYGTSSDERMKRNIRPLADDLDSGDIIDRLQVRAFEWRQHVPGRKQETEYGFIAQELHEVVPLAVMPGVDDAEENEMGGRPWQSDNSKIVPFLVAELQAVRRRLEALEA